MSRRYRGSARDTGPADAPIQSDTAFWGTLQNAARLYGVPSSTLCERLLRAGRRGAPVSAGMLYLAAADLARDMARRPVRIGDPPPRGRPRAD